MPKLKIKVAIKEAEQFAKKFWNSAVAKMPGKSKSGATTTAPAPPPPTRTSAAPPPQNRTSAAPVEDSTDPYQNEGSSTSPASNTEDPYNNSARQPRNTSPPPSAPPPLSDAEDEYNTQSRTARDATQPPSPPPQAPPTAATNVDPQFAEYQRLSKQVEDEVYKLTRLLPDMRSESWRERLVKATNKAHQQQPDYATAITELKQIQQDLSQERGPLELAAYDESCQRFERKLRHEAAQILGDKAVPLGRAYINTFKEVIDGKLTPDKAIPVIEKLTRDLGVQTEKRMQAILAVTANYERLQPALSRAKAALTEPTAAVPPNIAEEANAAIAEFDQSLNHSPVIRQFFPEGTPAHAPPPPPPSIASIEDAVADGFKGGLKNADLDALKRSLAELEKLIFDVIKSMDVKAEIDALSESLPVDPSKLKLTNKVLGKGRFAETKVITADGVPPMAAKIPNDTTNGPAEIDREAAIYARLGDHPNIVKCYGKQQLPSGETALVMEMVEGKEATAIFNDLALRYNAGEIDREEYIGSLQHMIHGILSGLAQFEALGLAHRDIKGDNIRFDPTTGEAKILDMGLVEDHATPIDPHSQMPIKWTPPEILTSGALGPQTDSYGLGQTAYQQFERSSARDKEQPWKVEASKGETTGDGTFFVPSQGARRSGETGNRDMVTGAANALDGQGNPTVMPLTKASDQKPGGEHKGTIAPGAKPGNYGAETAYVDFLNKLMHPDPAKRMSPSEALQHPFMTQRLLEPEQASKVIQPPQPWKSPEGPRNERGQQTPDQAASPSLGGHRTQTSQPASTAPQSPPAPQTPPAPQSGQPGPQNQSQAAPQTQGGQQTPGRAAPIGGHRTQN